MSDLTLSFVVDRPPADVVATINDVRCWWTGDITGPTDRLGVSSPMSTAASIAARSAWSS